MRLCPTFLPNAAKSRVNLAENLPRNVRPSSKGQGKGKQTGQRRGEGKSSDATEDDLVNAVARLVLRHDEQLLALTSDLCYISYVRTDAHSVLQELHAESKRQRSLMAPTSPPRHALTLRFFRAFKDRVVQVSQSEAVQQKLKQEGVMTMHGEWPYLEWSSERLGDRLSVPVTTMVLPGGETPLGAVKSGETPSSSSEIVTHGSSVRSEGTVGGSGNLATVDEALPEIREWLGEEGSLGSFRESAKNPKSPLAYSISKGLAACLRHNHKPRIHVNEAGWARLSEVLFWPRIAETSASAGDILEVVRSYQKQKYQLGLQDDGPYFIRAVQGHSRTEVGEENLLEPVSEEQLPDTLLHGTSWNAYESIQQRGLLPGRTQTTSSKGGRKGGKWREGRQHVHFFSDAGGVSGQREGSTMLVRISTRKASEQGVRFLISRNGVYLTPDEVPPVCITSFQSLRTGDLYDRDGERIQSSG